MLELARAQLQVFESSHGQFFWNFRTELEPRWSYLEVSNDHFVVYHSYYRSHLGN